MITKLTNELQNLNDMRICRSRMRTFDSVIQPLYVDLESAFWL